MKNAMTSDYTTNGDNTDTDSRTLAPTVVEGKRHEVVFIDSQVQDYQQLISGLKPGSEVVVLDGSKDGLQQIADFLQGRSGMDAIHIVSHGLPGQVTLGSLTLGQAGLDARATELAQIGQSLGAEGDILLHGCDVGSGAAGQMFVDRFVQLTGADVAASDNLTGAASKGGDWVLEVSQGAIDTAVITGTDEFAGLLAVAADENYDDNALGTVAVTNTFTLNGVKYTITGTEIYQTAITNDPFSPLGSGSDHYLLFDQTGLGGISSIKIEMADGSAFSLAGFSLDGIADDNLTITTSAGGTRSYVSNGIFITQENVNTGADSGFKSITSFTISGGNLQLALDDLNFEPAAPTLVSATFSDNNLKIGETSTVTFTFSTAVTGFTTADLTVPNGIISGLSSSNSGLTWTGLFTPNSSVTDSTNVITVNLAGVNAVSGGLAGTGTADSSNYAIDTLAPSVMSVTSSTPNGTYKVGDVISIQVNFGESVTVTGTPQLTLETGSTGMVNYTSGSGTSSLTFTYMVQDGDSAADLDYISSTALALNGGSIVDAAGNDAILTLAAPGAAGSLGANKNIAINSAPTIVNLNGDSVAWAGGGNTVVLDASGNAQLSDTEFGALNGGNGNWAGASLTIQRNGTALSSDVLGFNTLGAQFTVDGNTLQSGGQTFATFANTGGVLTITFTSSGTAATTALVNDVAQRVTYRNDTPAGDTTLRYSLNDGTSTVAANVAVTSDIITVTNTTDTATIDLSNGVSFSEAVAIAASDATGSQTIAFASTLAGQTLNLNTVSLNESLTFDVTQANGLTLTGGTVTLAGGTTQVFNVGFGFGATISSLVAGSGALTKAGGGQLTLSNSNTNTGNTTVSAGTMVVDGSTNTATTVASGATLAGNGTLGGDVNVQSGGTLSPGGAGVGTLTVNGNLTLNPGGTLALNINGATAGTGYDRVVVNGTVNISGAILAVTHGYAAGSGDSYTVIVNDVADAVTGTFSGISEGSNLNASGNGTALTTSYIGGTGNDLTLTTPIAPTVTYVSSSTPNGTYKIGDTITITVHFDSTVNVTGTPTLTLETGAYDRALSYVSGSGTDTLSFSYTVQPGDSSVDLDYLSTSALSLAGGTIQDGNNQAASLTLPSPGAAGSLGANKALVIDGVRPAATGITLSDTALSVGETATVTITFNERVTGLTTNDFAVGNGELSNLSSSDGGLTWTATVTPSANVSDATNLITLDNTGLQDLAGNTGSGTTDSGNYAIDTQRPTASAVVTDNALNAGQSTTVTATFSEAVSGLTTADFTVANGVLSNLTTSDNITYTATLTPNANVTDPTNLVTLDNTGYTDAAGNTGTGTTDSNNYTIDTQRPTATIVVIDTALIAGQSTTVIITFSEAVTGLATEDFSVANGSLSGLSSSDGGLTWTATLTPGADVTDATNLITLDNTGYTDAAGNTGTGISDSNNYAIDTKAPAVTSVSVPPNGTYVESDALDFTVNFDEALTVDTTGGTPRLAITLDTGGTAYANYLSGSGSTALVFRLTVANGQQDHTGIAIDSLQFNGGTLRDALGNDVLATLNSVGDTSAVWVDALAPSLNATGSTPADNATNVAIGDSLVLAFSEPLDPVGSDTSAVYLKDVATDTFVPATISIDVSGALVIDPIASLAHGKAYYVTWGAGALVDAAGNAAAAVADESTYNFTTQAAPVVSDPEEPTPPTPPTPPVIPGVPDNDGIPAEVEDKAPGIPGPDGTTMDGDGNGDGIKDSQQPSVGSISFLLSPTAQSNPGNAPPTFTTLVASSRDGKVDSGNDNSRITSLQQLDAPQDVPEGMQTPLGLVSFTVTLAEGKTGENFSLYLDPSLGINGYWKQDASGTWVNLASEPYGGKTVMEGGRLRLDFHIEDGGQFDADGKVDGIITDPGAPGYLPLSLVGMAPDMPHGFWF